MTKRKRAPARVSRGEPLGDLIIEALDDTLRDHTLETLAREVGLSPSTISRARARHPIDDDTRAKIIGYLRGDRLPSIVGLDLHLPALGEAERRDLLVTIMSAANLVIRRSGLHRTAQIHVDTMTADAP